MCGRYDLDDDGQQVEISFGVDLRAAIHPGDNLQRWPAYNIAPTQSVLTVTSDGKDRKAELMDWGLTPFWIASLSHRARYINARAETVTDRMFREPFSRRRCLIPATGYYEWMGPPRAKQPMRITMKSGEVFAFAGIYEQTRLKNFPERGVVTSCSILTTVPNQLLEVVHNRMPVILPPELYDDWLDPANQDIGELKEYLLPYDASLMTAYPVSSDVGNVRNEGAHLIEPVGPAI